MAVIGRAVTVAVQNRAEPANRCSDPAEQTRYWWNRSGMSLTAAAVSAFEDRAIPTDRLQSPQTVEVVRC